MLSKFGPVDLLTITKMAQPIQENLWNHPGNILFMSIWESTKFENFRNMCVLGTQLSVFSFCLFAFVFSLLFVCLVEVRV